MQKVKSDIIRLDVINLLKTKLKKEGIEKCTPSSFEIDVATLLLKYNINFDFNQQIVHNTTTQIPKLFSSDLFLNKNTNSKSLLKVWNYILELKNNIENNISRAS